jgi:signal transduction histidine kinase
MTLESSIVLPAGPVDSGQADNIPHRVLEKWQSIVDTMAELLSVPAGLIMRINGADIECLIASRTPGNPYHPGDSEHLFGSGLYCETVINGRNRLLVPNALIDPHWKNNPDIKLNMISYLGFPLVWPDARPFGTICVLDCKGNSYSEIYKRLIEQFRDIIEQHLALIYAENRGRQNAEEQIRKSEALLNQAQEVGQIGSWRLDAGCAELSWSREQFRIFGFNSVNTQPSLSLFLERIHPSDRQMFEQSLEQAIRRKEKCTQDYRIVLPDGSIKFLHSVAQPFVKPTGGIELIGTVIDMTERRAIEERLRTAEAELSDAARLTAMGGLLASIAHEIKQPLTGVVANARAGLRWLDRQPFDRSEVRNTLLRAASDGLRASEIIDGIRAMTRKPDQELATVDIKATVEELLLLMRNELWRYDIVATVNFDETNQESYCNRVQIQQVLLNLIMNGVEAMNSVADRPRLLNVSGQPAEPEYLLVKVEDTGTGIGSEMGERMFEPFYTTKPNGMGIGLSICRSIIEAHGGSIWASPRAQHGTMLCFTVPTTQQSNELN